MKGFFKKALSVFTAMAMALSLMTGIPFSELDLGITASAAVSGSSGYHTWSIDDDGTFTIKGSYDRDATKYKMVDHNLQSLPRWYYDYNESITKVVIGEYVSSIGNYAFFNLPNLTSVTIPEGVTSIGENAFDSCSSLTSITIPEGVTSIGENAFISCSSLESITIPASVTSIGDKAFYIIGGGATVDVPCSWNENPLYTFSYGVKVNIPAHATDNGECECGSVFGTCGNDLKWTLIGGTLTISGTGDMADYSSSAPAPWNSYKDKITNVVIGNGITSIDDYAFYGCTSLTSITIPNSVTTIGSYAFNGCTSLESVVIPNRVTTISFYAFSNCGNLTEITIPASVTEIDNTAFLNCDGLTTVNVPCSWEENPLYTFEDGVTVNIAEHTGGTADCQGNAICSECNSSYTTTPDPSNHTYTSNVCCGTCGDDLKWTLVDGTLTISGTGTMADYAAEEAPWYSYAASITSAVIESGVTSIGDRAFYNCTRLKSITIPNSVTAIGNGTFMECASLESITLPTNLTTIGNFAFVNCTKITSITIPASVTSIDIYSFVLCEGLTSVTIPASVTEIGNNAFYNCTSLKSVTIPDSVTSIGEQAFYGIASNATVNVPCNWDGTLYTFESGVTINKSEHTGYSANGAVISAECSVCEGTGTLTISAQGGTYDGTTAFGADVAKTGTLENADVAIAYYKGETALDSAPVNAGTYTARITYGGVTASVEFTINAIDPTYTAPTTVANLVYDGNEQALVSASSVSTGGTMKYSLDGVSYTTAIPTGTNADTYNVYWMVEGDENHNDVTCETPISVTIAKADSVLTTTPSAVTGLVYTGSAQNLITAAATADGEIQYSLDGITYTSTVPTGTVVDTYTVYYKIIGDSNHNDKTFDPITVSIGKGVAPAITEPTATAITYGDTLSASELSDGSWAWIDGTIVPDATANHNAYIEVDDSNYDYTSVDGYDSANHRVVRGVQVQINRAALTITAKSYTIKVGGTLPTYEYDVAGLVGNDTLPVTVSISCSAADSNTLGTYPITVSGDAETDLYAITYVNGELTITEKDTQTITASDVTLTYGETGKKITATTNGDGAISYEVATGTDVISVATDGTITAFKAGTATVTINAAETDTYAAATKTVTVTVNKAAVTVTAMDITIYIGGEAELDYTVEGLVGDDILNPAVMLE